MSQTWLYCFSLKMSSVVSCVRSTALIGWMRTKNNTATGVQHVLKNMSFDKLRFQLLTKRFWRQRLSTIECMVVLFSHSIFNLRDFQVNSVQCTIFCPCHNQGSSPVHAWIFSGFFRNCISYSFHCVYLPSIIMHLKFRNMRHFI